MLVGTHPLQIPVDHALRVEVIEALCDVDQLAKFEATCRGGTIKGSQERPNLVVGSI